jgi:hypothetical protein
MSNILQRHPGEVARALRTRRYDHTGDGRILLRDSRVFIGGALRVRDYQDFDELHGINANTLLAQGLTHIVNNILVPTGGYAQVTQWYVAPYSGDYTPDPATLTAANFTATATEFTAYTAATRLALVVPTAATTPDQTSDEVQMIFNAAGGPFNIYGAALLSVAAKSNAGGKALAAIRLDNPRLAMANSDKLGFAYELVASDAG